MIAPTKQEISTLISLVSEIGCYSLEDIFNLSVVLHQTDWRCWGTHAQMDGVQPGYEYAYTRGMILLLELCNSTFEP
jgi:hypothetical protein